MKSVTTNLSQNLQAGGDKSTLSHAYQLSLYDQANLTIFDKGKTLPCEGLYTPIYTRIIKILRLSQSCSLGTT